MLLALTMTQKVVYMTDKDKRRYDIFLGKRLRHRRELLGFTLREISAKLGITYQKLQRYETGKDVLRFETLLKIADVLRVKLSYFDMNNKNVTELEGSSHDTSHYKRSICMMKSYNNIKCPHIKNHLYKLIVDIDKNLQ